MSEPRPSEAARRAAEQAARASYGRLVAMLTARTRDIAAAEDALAEAFARALDSWSTSGVPERPEAWLLTVARRELLHGARHRDVQRRSLAELLARAEEEGEEPGGAHGDPRLALLFVCAHPAIDAAVRTPLMLQTVLGLDAQRIASAFLTSPTAMAQRLVRAKAKIRDAGVPFDVPEPHELPARLDDVLSAVYAAFGAGWDDLGCDKGLAEEAIFLGRMLVAQLPEQPEPKGLLALMLYSHARRAARRDPDGRFVPLARQDARLWHAPSIVEAEQLLTAATHAAQFGRFQCEAAIQSVHAQRAITGVLQHHALITLYDLLLDHAPSIGVAIARAAALIGAGALVEAERALAALPAAEVVSYQPYWVTLAELAERRGDGCAARDALGSALGVTEDPAVRAYLQARLAYGGSGR